MICTCCNLRGETFRIGAQNVLSSHFPQQICFPDPAPRLVGILSVSKEKHKSQRTNNERQKMITFLNPDDSKWPLNYNLDYFLPVNFTGCCIFCSNSNLVDTETTCREIWCHLRQYDTSQRKNPALICLFPTINGN